MVLRDEGVTFSTPETTGSGVNALTSVALAADRRAALELDTLALRHLLKPLNCAQSCSTRAERARSWSQ